VVLDSLQKMIIDESVKAPILPAFVIPALDNNTQGQAAAGIQ
jgi:hypothetical protein